MSIACVQSADVSVNIISTMMTRSW